MFTGGLTCLFGYFGTNLYYFVDRKIKDVTYIILNKKTAKGMKFRLESAVDFKVYQAENGDIWDKLDGRRNDFFIFDKCGRLSYFLDQSASYLGWPHVRLVHAIEMVQASY